VDIHEGREARHESGPYCCHRALGTDLKAPSPQRSIGRDINRPLPAMDHLSLVRAGDGLFRRVI
jgi:hypothetical protein